MKVLKHILSTILIFIAAHASASQAKLADLDLFLCRSSGSLTQIDLAEKKITYLSTPQNIISNIENVKRDYSNDVIEFNMGSMTMTISVVSVRGNENIELKEKGNHYRARTICQVLVAKVLK